MTTPPIPPPHSHPAPAVPAPRTSRVGLVIVGVLGVLLLTMLSAVFFLIPGDSTPSTAVGDCVKLTGVETDLKYEKVSCDGRLHNYTVSKVLGLLDDRCGDDPGAYATYNNDKGFNGEQLCLIPVFFDGECYDFMLASHTAENPVVDCGATGAVKVRVLTDTADEAACGTDPVKALAYRETKTTYCFDLPS
ncbi:LppU/SCO3897 family protein [Lentzea californiensis]|uniref:LppU/SCO3897 family protein n=1 Tax=Lentzea californiensis TaxID=438851 RepID=UPI0021668B3A|nr:hypothetical protein [Lentzea californiensis]MCR3753037.1 hypothetical protein [Lentzea californiensis]